MSTAAKDAAGPPFEVRIVMPHDFLVQEVRPVHDQTGRLTEVVIVPYVGEVGDQTAGTVAYLAGVMTDPTGKPAVIPTLEIRASRERGVTMHRPRGLGRRRKRGGAAS